MPGQWGLTPGEKRALLLICVSLLMGLGYRLYQRQAIPEVPPLNAADSAAFLAIRQAYFQSATGRQDRTDVTEGDLAQPDTIKSSNSSKSGSTSGKATLLDLNTATKEQLESLPGIGPVLAERIIAERNRLHGFGKPDDLLNVPGIGSKRWEKIRPLVFCSKTK